MSHDNAIELALRADIRKHGPGHRLPSVRALQERLHASPVSIQKVVAELRNEGLLITRPGDGTFVAVAPKQAVVQADTTWQSGALGRAPAIPFGLEHLGVDRTSGDILLDNGFPDPSLHATALLSKLAATAAKRASAWDRCPPEGHPELRDRIARELRPDLDRSHVIITPGGQAALDAIFRSFAQPGDAVVLEEPCYPGAIGAATLAGLRVVPVATDRDGVIVEELERALATSRARVVMLQPRYANPTGAVLAEDRRADVMALVERFGAFIIEDDWVRDLDLDGLTPRPLATSDKNGHVIYLRSFSKVAAPGVRLAGVVVQGQAWARLRGTRLLADFFAVPLLQEAVNDMLASPAWQRHLQDLRSELRVRRDTLIASLHQSAPDLSPPIPAGGVGLWCRLPAGMDEARFVAGCQERGVRVGPGASYWIAEPPAPHVRIAFAGAPSPILATASQRIGLVLKDLAASPGKRRR